MFKEIRCLIVTMIRLASSSCPDLDLDVAASALAVTRSCRVTRAARSVTMTGAVDLALNDDAVAVVAVVSVNQERQQSGNEEEDDVPEVVLVMRQQLTVDEVNLHDAKCP
jgi:hypothetical protein